MRRTCTSTAPPAAPPATSTSACSRTLGSSYEGYRVRNYRKRRGSDQPPCSPPVASCVAGGTCGWSLAVVPCVRARLRGRFGLSARGVSDPPEALPRDFRFGAAVGVCMRRFSRERSKYGAPLRVTVVGCVAGGACGSSPAVLLCDRVRELIRVGPIVSKAGGMSGPWVPASGGVCIEGGGWSGLPARYALSDITRR